MSLKRDEHIFSRTYRFSRAASPVDPPRAHGRHSRHTGSGDRRVEGSIRRARTLHRRTPFFKARFASPANLIARNERYAFAFDARTGSRAILSLISGVRSLCIRATAVAISIKQPEFDRISALERATRTT